MTAYTITERKNFMSKLLATDCFDSFLLREAVITTYNTFTINGQMEPAFFTSEEWDDTSIRPYELSCWSDIRPICFSLIKGKKTPVSMKFVLHLKPEHAEQLIAQSEGGIPKHYIQAFAATIRYDGDRMTCTTGISFLDFLPDKTPERMWDETFHKFLVQKNIAFDLD